ncbi:MULTISPECIES: PTS sugar transporter subunit IIA [Globicatella]|uniref:PTS glucose transporter subunit IIA n=1 Tax=Globicatella sulfidifaciens TaxID=136093 RepID=A0A7X8C5R0_9LACT|nr:MULTISPECIES: PTS glucose transporter subunit IIA [Globicatella]MDK7631480.1 PTS glucose transporter subunit IIA [Globicatella sanguinis]NLJ19294.1 PTS glucose transporter subunit IIA [Globicatella sulfidifaciens]WIK66972.1 PTS glucose transporter subunit IIA [Globicatella sanguinis]WKT56377.1 PTS glucose transporter subunit IIA [Globicatella sanguinis]WPC08254.1 PTS glucose transporter subunit IIA [Globicatella sp. PHS-GS-PNBC-21-1553]
MFGFFKKKQQEKEPVIKEIKLYAPADGELINIEQVNDVVFAQKMMGDGFAVLPTNGSISSPVEGTIVNVFPTQHAVGFKAGELEVLLHMGIDTVSLNGEPFETDVNENDKVTASSKISEVDLDALATEGKDNAMIVIFTNGSEVIEEYKITASGNVTKGQEIGYITLK